ncbi:MAG: DUF4783 domain-containing protein [bacterium]
MNHLKFILVPLFILHTSLFSIGNSFTFPDRIQTAIKQGNAAELASFFNSSIELVILDDEHIYSKSQAEQILKDFFRKYPPESFIIIHEGGKEVSQYAIGKLKSSSNTFRITIFLSKNSMIHQMRIEKDNDV